MASTKPTPTLTPELLADDAAVAVRIDELLRLDPRYRQHARAILRALDALRGVLTDREWASYVDLEIVTMARLTYTLPLLVRWAFAQGQEHPACARR